MPSDAVLVLEDVDDGAARDVALRLPADVHGRAGGHGALRAGARARRRVEVGERAQARDGDLAEPVRALHAQRAARHLADAVLGHLAAARDLDGLQALAPGAEAHAARRARSRR